MANATKGNNALKKAAVLLVSLGKERSANILKLLSDEQIETLAAEIANISKVDHEVQRDVMSDFLQACESKNLYIESGMNYVHEILDKSLGEQKAFEMMGKLNSTVSVRPFESIKRMDPAQLSSIIQHEHPQTIAVVLSYMNGEHAAAILGALPHDKQADVVARISRMGKIAPEYIKEIERIIEKKLMTVGVSDNSQIGGINKTVKILNSVDRGTEKFILEALSSCNQELAEEIKGKMFVFEDITKLQSSDVQRVLKDIPNDQLVLALKGVKQTVVDFIIRTCHSVCRK